MMSLQELQAAASVAGAARHNPHKSPNQGLFPAGPVVRSILALHA